MTVELVHGDQCECVRCRGFAPGNQLAERHGCYSRIRLAPRAAELRDELAALVPLRAEPDDPLVDVLALTLAQVERAGLVLGIEQARIAEATEAAEELPPRLDRLAADARAWVRLAAGILDSLGMSPTSRARLGVDVVTAQKVGADLVERYGGRVA